MITQGQMAHIHAQVGWGHISQANTRTLHGDHCILLFCMCNCLLGFEVFEHLLSDHWMHETHKHKRPTSPCQYCPGGEVTSKVKMTKPTTGDCHSLHGCQTARDFFSHVQPITTWWEETTLQLQKEPPPIDMEKKSLHA